MYSQDPLFTNVLRNAEQPIIRCDALRRTRALYGLCGRLIQGFETEGGDVSSGCSTDTFCGTLTNLAQYMLETSHKTQNQSSRGARLLRPLPHWTSGRFGEQRES